MEKQYAQAIEMLRSRPGTDDKKLVNELVAHLKAAGRVKLLPGILRELNVLEYRRGKLAPSVEAASEKEAHAAVAEAKKQGIDVAKARVNHALISGWRGRSGSTLVDKSAKQGLIDLYRRVTS